MLMAEPSLLRGSFVDKLEPFGDPAASVALAQRAVFDLDSRTLTETARAIREGGLPHGTKVAGAAPFFIGAADLPIDPPPGWQPNGLTAKVAAGAQFVQTQFCMDTAIVPRYPARLAAGLSNRPFLLVGVSPLRSAKSAAWMRRHLFGSIIPDAHVTRLEQATDASAEGRKICIETIEALSLIPGIAGAHIMAPGNDAAILEVITAARRTVTMAAKAR